MFNFNHYVPVLRSKNAEWRALRRLEGTLKHHITPLIELMPERVIPNSAKETLELKVADIVRRVSTCGMNRLFVSGYLLPSGLRGKAGEHPLQLLWNGVASQTTPLIPQLGLTLIPVITLDADPSYRAAVQVIVHTQDNGVALRLFRKDLTGTNLYNRITTLLNALAVPASQVDLIMDYQVVDRTSIPNIANTCQSIPFLDEWRTFIVLAGAFPEDLTQVPVNSEKTLDRHDWQAWYMQVPTNSGLPRQPAYGDYVIQWPLYKRPGGWPSASIRYASQDYWVIFRGEQLRVGGKGNEQYAQHALALTERDEYFGPICTPADTQIARVRDEFLRRGLVTKPGSPTTWLEVGTNRHLLLTAHQVVNGS